MLALGNEKNKLDPADLKLIPLPSSLSSNTVTNDFERYWSQEKSWAKSETRNKEKNTHTTKDEDATDLNCNSKGNTNDECVPSLARCLWKAFGSDFIRAGVLKLVHDLCIFVGPQVLNRLILFLGNGAGTAVGAMREGLLLTVLVTASQITMSLCLRHYFFGCYRVGLRIRTAVVYAVYKKSLVLSSYERQTRSSGEIINLISVDAQRLQDLTTYLHAIWYSFLQIGLAIYFLWRQLGISCLGGVAVIILMIPITKATSRYMGKMQKTLMSRKDVRVEKNNEVLGSIKVIKLQSWEESFLRRLMHLRGDELAQLFKYLMFKASMIMLWSAAPLLVALATFATYVLSGNRLDVASALTSLALFDILRFPLNMLPSVINNLVEANISLKRITLLLLCDEHVSVGSGQLRDDGELEIVNASFVYDSKRPKDSFGESKGGVTQWQLKHMKDMADAKWEISLLHSQLAYADNRIKELEKGAMSGMTSGSVDETSALLPSSSSRRLTNNVDLLSLKRINFKCQRGEFVVVVGAVGAGKSSLMNSLLGEIRCLSGHVSLKGRIGYFAQTPFIMNDTLRGNILFGEERDTNGKPLKKHQYRRALSTCALKHDLELLPNGDLCEIGEKGITLSGGQKARVALARAVYMDADVYLLDDPLAAVDAHVGKHIFHKCIVDELLLGGVDDQLVDGSDTASVGRKRTVILTTNALQYLKHPLVDRILVMDEGCIKEMGSYMSLVSNRQSLFYSFLQSFQDTLGSDSASDTDMTEKSSLADNNTAVATSRSSLSALADVTEEPEVAKILSPRRGSSGTSPSTLPMTTPLTTSPPASSKLMTDEFAEREIGHVNPQIYLTWAKAAGSVWLALLIIITYATAEGITVMSKWWLTYWGEHGGDSTEKQLRFLMIYAGINLGAILAAYARVCLVMLCGLRASRKLFSRLLEVVLHAPMSFFDTTPIGRIINRFSKDISTVDESLVDTIRSYLATISSVISVMIVILSVTPTFLFFVIPLILYYIKQQLYFTVTYRELKRLDSVSRSPIYALLGETLDGVSTIRALDSQQSFMKRMLSMIDKQQNAYFLTVTAQCWLAVRLELIGTLTITFACLCAVIQHGRMLGDSDSERETFAGLAGLSISFALSVTQSLNWSVRMSSDLEANMISVERIEQYCQIPREGRSKRLGATSDDQLIVPSSDWPSEGMIEFQDAALRYRPGLPLVLKGLYLTIPARAKIGVVGRTGAGKSTLMVALLRLVELDAGKILIDGIDISRVDLANLRSKIAVIPQDPVLFSGSIRTNLDPFNEYSDERLSAVLERFGLWVSDNADASNYPSGMKSSSSGVIKSLSDHVFEGGSNFSVGQRQLLVIARALLREATIIIMDEATAAVDSDTDAKIQAVMRTEFREATCITVAHRINTIMDSDYILVMDDGKAAEFDRPITLLAREEGGLFKDLVEAWEKEHEH